MTPPQVHGSQTGSIALLGVRAVGAGHVLGHGGRLSVNGRRKACHPGLDGDHNMYGAYEWASSARASLDERAEPASGPSAPRSGGGATRLDAGEHTRTLLA